MQKIFVTGGAGFIGSHLSEALLGQGNEVICLDNFNGYYAPQIKRRNIAALLEHRKFSLLEQDILDLEFLKEYFGGAKIDIVVHLAARAGVRPSIQMPLLYQKVNVEGTNNLLEVSKDAGVDKFIFASSSSVYGANEKVPFSEDDFVDNPISPYASTKKAGELICYTYAHLYKLPITCLRFFTVYGPRQRPDMAIHKFTKAIYNNSKITMYGDGCSRRDYTFITDVIDGILKSIDHCHDYHVYNLGESKTIELRKLIDLIADCTGRKPEVEFLPNQPGDVPITYADITRAQTEIGYQPSVGIEQGLEKFVKWFTEIENLL
ncbi:MAG: GDP-mannose 4,6-dehydratase [bacterium]